MPDREPTTTELMDAIVQLHAYVESGFASIYREFAVQRRALQEDLRQELHAELGREVGALRHDMNRRFDRVDQRFDRVDQRFDALEVLVNRLEARD